jgi:hypothetical protein
VDIGKGYAPAHAMSKFRKLLLRVAGRGSQLVGVAKSRLEQSGNFRELIAKSCHLTIQDLDFIVTQG